MKILSTLRAGPVVRLTLYSPREKNPNQHHRAMSVSLEDKKRANLKTSYEKLTMKVFANFSPGDWWITLSYEDQYLPADREASRVYWHKFIRPIRKARKANGETLKYIYCTQLTTSDGGIRLHHHMILRAEDDSDKELVLESWRWGIVKRCRRLKDIEDLKSKSNYMCREPRTLGVHIPGEQMWTPSRGLITPKPTYTIVENDAIDISVPVGCVELADPIQLPDYGGYKSILYFERP